MKSSIRYFDEEVKNLNLKFSTFPKLMTKHFAGDTKICFHI